MPELAEKLGIPYNNLTKLVQNLSKAGVLSTRQGKHGGIRLAKLPSEISLKDIIDTIDGPTQLSECLSTESGCVVHCGCKLKSAFGHIQSEINQMFENVKIGEVA